MTSLERLVTGDLEHELATTRRLLERVPDEHFDWKPHEKSWTLARLAGHIARLPEWQTAILLQSELDLASVPPPSSPPKSRDEVVRTFDKHAVAAKEALQQTHESALVAPWTLRRGDDVIMTRPRAAFLRDMGISHMVHHRAQLGVYLRLLNVAVPPCYGPTADEGVL